MTNLTTDSPIDTKRELVLASKRIPARVARMTDADRRAMVPALKKARSALTRRSWWDNYSERHAAVQLWGLGCLRTPTEVARWLTVGATRHTETPHELLIECLEASGRDNAWRAELAERLAAGRSERWTGLPYFPLIVHLVRTSKAAVPSSDGFVTSWVGTFFGPSPTIPSPWNRHQLPTAPNLLARFRIDPFFSALAHRVVEVDGISPVDSAYPENSWPHALSTLAAEGVIDRSTMHTHILDALLRPGARPGETASRLKVLIALGVPTADCASHVDTYARLLTEGRSSAAVHAQQVLIDLHRAGSLPAEQVVVLSAEALMRTEKKLLRTQLTWLEGILRAEPALTPDVLRLLGDTAATVDDATLRERIDKLITRFLPAVDEQTRMELAAAQPISEIEDEFPLPPPTLPTPAHEVPLTPELTAERYQSASGDWYSDPLHAELFFEGVVRFAHADRDALTAALTPMLDEELRRLRADTSSWWQRKWWKNHDWTPLTIAALVTGALRERPRATRASDPLTQRMAEWGNQLLSGAPLPPFALAAPMFTNGQITAGDLVERLRAYQDSGITPGPMEFAQALVRVLPTGDAETIAAAAALGSPEGARLATWLRGEHVEGLPKEFLAVLIGPDSQWDSLPCKPIEFPQPEPLAQWSLWNLWHAWDDDDNLGNLLRLVELPGPKGATVHRTVASQLVTSSAKDRTAAVDAVVALAASGELRPELLADGLPTDASNKRLAGSLRDIVIAMGAHHAWPLFTAVIPTLIARGRTTGLADVLAVAADCARRCGTSEAVRGVEAIAGRSGSGRLVTEARGLMAVVRASEV